MSKVVISVSNLSYKINEKWILKNITFEVKRGDFVGIVGPNGAGKSTLIKILVGEIKNFEGHVKLYGKIGYIPQFQTINREVPINSLQFIKMGAYKRKVKESYIKKLLNDVGLAGKEKQLIGTMSGGELQRLSLARALLYEPDILILDEPEAGVDQMGKARFYDLLYEFQKKLNLTILMVSHDIGMIFEKCNTIMCLNKTLHCHGPSKDVRPEEINTLFPDFDIWLRSKNHYERKHKHGDF
ncbi:metal ABC transporter ATP-binding protein [Thermosipho melanesiensis]|uniref:ABC transporter related n=2 Tax=Thermosipho melanesiensis TaxID=46541 RepID=A6LK50_THEM4|nr:metal ABC transporter ATP-binding protein [Thermosipho melanesiensis]ABR30301.1 ABC transporter related [Thermosipho melanesiensis BI429]APT73475.1 metal ABC transporter ATP-binding protein [Thermosipho melanesiensis]OOC37423.1 metal ABC transporter ATP-binding protein [Thermosipho melanesiensis]OOC39785.1 metal ABC transporter ATP-binding protein [Thermosipho melanesiensis]OOC39890.1 metal ABC transporter ATP-binding protein [Thermosipho melanesiensis]